MSKEIIIRRSGPDYAAGPAFDQPWLEIMLYLYVVEEADTVFLMHHTRLSRAEILRHLEDLEKREYVSVTDNPKKNLPSPVIRLTREGRLTFAEHRESILGKLPSR